MQIKPWTGPLATIYSTPTPFRATYPSKVTLVFTHPNPQTLNPKPYNLKPKPTHSNLKPKLIESGQLQYTHPRSCSLTHFCLNTTTHTLNPNPKTTHLYLNPRVNHLNVRSCNTHMLLDFLPLNFICTHTLALTLLRVFGL